MKIILNEEKLREYMKKNGVKNYRQLCHECGVNYYTFSGSKCRISSLSSRDYWLIANYLGCHVEEIQTADWAK